MGGPPVPARQGGRDRRRRREAVARATAAGGGEVSALLTDSSLIRASSESGVERLVAVFATNSGSPVVIDDSVSGLEVELQVTDGGYGIQFDGNSGEVIDFGSMPFKPIFTTY